MSDKPLVAYWSSGGPCTLEDAKRQVGPGWGPLVELLWTLAARHGIRIAQVKEKYGGLRFYVDTAPEWFHDLTWEATGTSEKTCEECGRLGHPRAGGWVRTLCDEHAGGRE